MHLAKNTSFLMLTFVTLNIAIQSVIKKLVRVAMKVLLRVMLTDTNLFSYRDKSQNNFLSSCIPNLVNYLNLNSII